MLALITSACIATVIDRWRLRPELRWPRRVPWGYGIITAVFLYTTCDVVIGKPAGNVAGAVVGVGEGFSHGASASFNNSSRVVRRWRTETTADGRVIQVPEDIEVDQYGRPLNSKPPTTPPAGKN